MGRKASRACAGDLAAAEPRRPWQGVAVTGLDLKADLHHYLQRGREALLWKLDGLSDYDVRRPIVPTGTNLLGLVKHVAATELGYFGDVFHRPYEGPLPRLEDESDPTIDMWAAAEESRDQIIELYHRAWAHSDATIAALPLDAVGVVPWWPKERSEVTLHRVLVHVTVDTHRHAGHADILRELIDGRTGLMASNDNLPPVDAEWWVRHRDRLERVAREAEQRTRRLPDEA